MLPNFKDFISAYFKEEDMKDKVKSMIEGQGFVLFFKKDDDIYGSTEDGRMVFASLKTPDKDLPKGWEKEASFTAFNLSKTLRKENPETIFSYKDLPKIKVLDNEAATKELLKQGKSIKGDVNSIKTNIRLLPSNLMQVKEKD